MSKRKPYEVTAVMSTVLRTHVMARSEERAIALAKSEAESGCMEELNHLGWIDDWQAVALPCKPRKQEVVS